MVEDFLDQLSAAVPSPEGVEDSDALRKKMKTAKRLELRLAYRKKLCNDGYACVPLILFVHICYLVTAGRPVAAHFLSREEWVQASYPLVETT